MVGAWEGGCGKLDQYGMQYTCLFANLCNAGAPGLRGLRAVAGRALPPADLRARVYGRVG